MHLWILNRVGVNNQILCMWSDICIRCIICSHWITLSSRIPSNQNTLAKQQESLSFSLFVLYTIYIIDSDLTSTVFRYSLFHGSSSFNTEPNPIANAFIFFRPKEEEEQKEANSSPSDTNTNANSEKKDGTVIIVVMEPDKEPFELQLANK